MGSAVAVGGVEVRFRATGIDAVQSGLRLVKGEAAGVANGFNAGASAAEGMSHSGIRALGELARGLGRVSQEGMTSAMGMREIAGSVMTLGASLGPGIGLAGIVITLGAVIGEVFMKARKEMQETQEKFSEEIGKMANAGQSAELQKKLRDLQYGTPYDDNGQLRGASPAAGAFDGSLTDLRYRMAYLQDKARGIIRGGVADNGLYKAIDALKPKLDAAEAQARQIQTAIDVMTSQPATMSGMLPMKITAARTKTADQTATEATAARDKEITLILEEAKAHGINNTELARAVVLYKQLQAEMAHPKDALQAAQLRKQAEALSALPGVGPANQLIGDLGKPPAFDLSDMFSTTPQLAFRTAPKVAKIPPSVTDGIIEDFAKNVQEPLSRAIKEGLSSTLSSAVSDGIMAGFESHSIAAGFKAAGKAVLAGIGGILEQMGGVWIQYGIAMTTLGQALWNPFTSGPAALAIGAALVALGASLGSVAHGSTSSSAAAITSLPALVSSGFVNGSSPATRASTVTPQQPVTNNITLLGNDPVAARQLQEILDRNAKLSGA